MTPREEKTYNETRLRNLKRRYAYLKEHASLVDEALHIKNEINEVELQLSQ